MSRITNRETQTKVRGSTAATWFTALLLLAVAANTACHRTAARRQQYLEGGNRYFEQKKFAEAQNEYQRAVEIDPTFAEGHYRLGLAQLQQEHWTAAANSLRRAVELAPDNLDARLRLGDILISSTQYADARQQAEQVLQRDPQNASAHRLLGQVDLHQFDYAGAKNEFVRAVALAPQDPQAYDDLALALLLTGEADAAEKNFQKAVAIKPDDPQALVNLANFYRGQKQSARAEQTLRQAMERNPRIIEFPSALADLYIYEGRLPDAKHVLDQIEANQRDYADARRQVAQFYLAHGDPASALERFRALANGGDQSAAKNVGECLVQLGRWSEAGQWIANHDKERRDVDFGLLRARAFLGEHRLREAVEQLKTLAISAPDVPAVPYYLGQANLQQEERAAAQSAFADALRIQPGYLPAALGLANISLQEKDSKAALNYASQIIISNFWLADAHLIAGSAYLLEGNLPESRKAFELAVALNPFSPDAHERLAKALSAQKDYRDAEKAYEDSLAIARAYAPALSGLADILALQGRARQASARIEKQIALAPNSYELQVVKAEFCIGQKNFACGEQAYRQALTLNPYYVNGYLALAHIYALANRPAAVVQQYEEARQKFPEYLPTYALLGQVYEFMGDFARARQVYQDALKVDPDFYLAQTNLARLDVEHDGSMDEALQLVQRAKSAQPDDPSVNDTLAWIYYKQGLYPSAVELLQSVVAKAPGSGKFHFHLGMAYLAQGKAVEGRKTLQAALQLGLSADDSRIAREALQKIGS